MTHVHDYVQKQHKVQIGQIICDEEGSITVTKCEVMTGSDRNCPCLIYTGTVVGDESQVRVIPINRIIQ